MEAQFEALSELAKSGEKLNFGQDFFVKFYQAFLYSDRWQQYIKGVGTTLLVTAIALVLGVLLGAIVAMIRVGHAQQKPHHRNPILGVLNAVCKVYVTVIRGVPVVVLLLIFYFIIMTSAEGITVGILTFGINSGAYMAELIRGGINSVDRGQMEAGRSLGMSKLQAMRKIIFPQALRYILPAIGNELIALLKETAVAGYVAVVDLTRAGNLVRNNTYDAVNPLLIVAATYLILVVALTKLLWVFERRLSNRDHRK